MLQSKAQTFNDGLVKIYKAGNASLPGDMPKDGLTLKNTLRYKERTVGFNRYYTALQHDIKVDLLIRCPEVKAISESNTDILVAVLNGDGNQFKVIQVQYPEDVNPPVMDLTLERLGVNYDIE